MRTNSKHIIYVFLSIFVLIAACGLPVTLIDQADTNEKNSDVERLSTQIAANIYIGLTNTAIQALLLQPTSTATLSPTPSLAAPASTPAPLSPFVSVSGNTNCRTGPGRNFVNLITLLTSQQAEVVGKNTGLKYWIIRIPGSTDTCWLWGGYATLVGNSTTIPEATSPPTPTALPTYTPSPVPTDTPSPLGSLTTICTTFGHDPVYDVDCTIWCPLYCPIRPDPSKHCYMGPLDRCQFP
jgi:hypothetical protein